MGSITRRATAASLVLVLLMLCAGTALAFSGATDSGSQKTFLQAVNEQFSAFEGLQTTLESATEAETGETSESMRRIIAAIDDYLAGSEPIVKALNDLPVPGANALENLRTACVGHIEITRYMMQEFRPILDYMAAMIEMNETLNLENTELSVEILESLDSSLKAFKQRKPPEFLLQTHDSLCKTLQLLFNGLLDVMLAVEYEDDVRGLAAQYELVAISAEIDGMQQQINEFTTWAGENQDKADQRIEEEGAKLRTRIDEMKQRFGL